MSNTLRRRLVVLVVLLQMVFFAAWYAHESGALRQPVAAIMVETASYDPRSLLSGQYIRLAYEFSRTHNGADPQPWLAPQLNYPGAKGNVWIVLKEEAGFYRPIASSDDKPDGLGAGEVVIKGTADGRRLDFGIERFFVPEGTAEPNRDDVTVRLNVYEDGSVRIDEVFVKGAPWP
ncbi:GDYXXLXY domain-containing protein [Rhodovibrionaceae bacterium A322]